MSLSELLGPPDAFGRRSVYIQCKIRLPIYINTQRCPDHFQGWAGVKGNFTSICHISATDFETLLRRLEDAVLRACPELKDLVQPEPPKTALERILSDEDVLQGVPKNYEPYWYMPNIHLAREDDPPIQYVGRAS